MHSEVSPPLAGNSASAVAPGWLRLALADLRRHPWRLINPLLYPLYRWYEHELASQVVNEPVPAHIGLILDGNRRFARGMGLEATLGHQYGVNKLREVLEWCIDLNVRHVTLYVFSTENFNRPTAEVEGLLDLFVRESARLLEEPRLKSGRVRVKIIGQRERLPERVVAASEALELSTAGHDGMLLTIALAYSGREEITDAVKALLANAAEEGRSLEAVAAGLKAEQIERYLYTEGVPDPDFIIRTSGEQRLSGFLIWQAAYSEFYFCDVMWPAFRRIDFLRAVRTYQRRKRRFGR
ncbi:MAG: di-trans,poly-cis-decaprenylcistransferase [Rhodanobacteraceae bacterium]|nr:MAG: di-trans,poly-cis-decaprenylcistransferase [Rhodanobacteraceae bacterium]